MRTLALLGLTAVLTTPLLAQGNPADPDKKVAGGGSVPAGWSYRLDDTTASIQNVKFAPMGAGLHFTTGPAGIYWRDADAVTGSFHTLATFVQTKAPTHPEAYGLILMGSDLKGPNQAYIYFLVRGDGMFSIRQRAGGNVTNVTTQGNRNGWVANPAVVKQDSATGKATNLLEIAGDATSKKVSFKVNGKTVHEMNATGGTVGIIGIRMNHNLDVHVDGFAVHKM
jgi:hypothetical protein